MRKAKRFALEPSRIRHAIPQFGHQFGYDRLQLRGGWRRVYVVSAVTALYLNFFVAVVQAYLKIQRQEALVPAQSEPPFALEQLAILALFTILGGLAVLKFMPALAHAGYSPNQEGSLARSSRKVD